jgi:translation initiation factor IF-3
MKRAVVELAGMGHPDAEPKLIGRNIHVMLTPLPANKRKAKFHVKGGEGGDAVEDDDDSASADPQAAEA